MFKTGGPLGEVHMSKITHHTVCIAGKAVSTNYAPSVQLSWTKQSRIPPAYFQNGIQLLRLQNCTTKGEGTKGYIKSKQ